MARSAEPGFYPSFNYQLTELTRPPHFEREVTLSISSAYTVLPPLRRARRNLTQIIGASWQNRTITVGQKYFKNQSYVPSTFDGYAFLNWRRESEIKRQLRSGSFDQIRASQKSGPGGLRVSIPFKSKALESLFGEGGAGLQVSGSRRISFAGTSNWNDGVSSVGRSQSRFPTLRMDQSFQFDIVGTIGSKIYVKVNQDSRVNIPLANRLEIRFNGGEDDIIQKIEAGNTTLSLPGASLLRYSSSVRGLFGIKTEAQVGPFKFVGIASQEKANTERASIVSGSSARGDTLRDYNYIRYKMFDLGFASLYESPDDSIIDFELYKSKVGTTNQPVFDSALMFLDPRLDINGEVFDSTESNNGGASEAVEKISKENYTVFSRQRTLIFEKRLPTATENVGIWLKLRRANPNDPRGPTYEIGNVDSVTVRLLLIKKNRADASSIVDGYEHRNIYQLPNNLGIDWDNPDINAIDLKVYQGNDKDEGATTSLSNQDGFEYIEIIGLDQIGSSQPVPDGKADFTSSLFDFQRRIVILPEREPFNTNVTFGDADSLKIKAPGIYNPERSRQDWQDDSKYFFVFESRVRTNTIQLSGANIVEGAEVVSIGSQTLVRGTDYNVVGNSIQLTSDRATDPAAEVTVDYEVAPLFTVEKKTLLGTRIEYEGTKNLQLGVTALFKSDKATTRKPKVGQETSQMTAWDLNGSYRFNVNGMTKVFDKLPFLNVKGTSAISLQGEIARSNPNPNVDGEAFIDDFEGSRQEIGLGTSRRRWLLSSRPLQVDPLATTRAKIFWYNPRNGVATQEVLNQEVTTSTATIFPLNIVYMPTTLRVDTLIVDTTIDSSVTPVNVIVTETPYHLASVTERANESKFKMVAVDTLPVLANWSGITNSLQRAAWNQTNAELLEIRLRIRRNPFKPTGYIHFDFGEVSEDVITNRRNDQEGDDNVYNPDESDDIGIDRRGDSAEKIWYADILSFLPDPNDPQGDNFPYDIGDNIVTPELVDINGNVIDNPADVDLQKLKKINGTERNFFDPIFTSVDAEIDLLQSAAINLNNNYFSFKASLDTGSLTNNFFVKGSESILDGDETRPTGWITMRIPVQDLSVVDTVIGNPSWTDINQVRMWIDSLADTIMIEIASIDLVSSNWRDTLLVMPDSARLRIDSTAALPTTKSIFNLSVINTSEDRIYIAPPGVTGNVDQINQITEPEQSLRLAYENFIFGDTGKITKPQTAVNYMGYRELRMFVHGDAAIGPTHQVDYYFRLGTDSLNYYEFRARLEPGWSDNNEVVMDFNELTALKDRGLKDELIDPTTGRLNTGDLDPRYRVVGLPTLRSVRYMSSGVTNADTADVNVGITGEVWVDELRLSNVRRDAGTSMRLSASGNIGSFITSYGVNISSTDAFYRDIARGTRRGNGVSLGSGSSDFRYSLSANFQMASFLPPSMKASIPIRVTYSKSTRTPLLVTANNSDIILPKERQIEERTISESKGFSIRESFSKNTKNLLYTVLLNRISTSFDYNRSESTSPTIPRSLTERYSASFAYDIQRFPTVPGIPVFFMLSKIPLAKRLAETRLNLSPTNFRLRSNFTRSLTVRTQNEAGNITSSHTRTLTTDIQTGARWLTNLTSRFSVNLRSDLRDPDWVSLSLSKLRFGKVTRTQQSFNHEFSPSIFPFLTHKFSFNSAYSENRQLASLTRDYLTANPLDSLLEPFDVSQNLRFSVSGSFDLKKFLGEPGRARSVNAASDNRRRLAEKAKKLREERRRREMGDTLSVDSLQQKDGKEEKKKDTGPKGPWIGAKVSRFGRLGLRKLTGFIDPVTASLDKGQSLQRNGLRVRPGPKFRFGFTDRINVPVVGVNRQTKNFSQSTGWRLGSGARFFGGGITTRIDISESRAVSHPSTGGGSESIDRNWPRLTITIRQFRIFDNIWGLRFLQGQLNSLIRRFGPQTSYARRTTERIDLSTGLTTISTEAIDRSPLLGVTIPIKRSLNITARYETSKAIRQSFLKTGVLSNANLDNNKTLRLSTQYSFRSPNGIRLPIFGKIKLNSTVSIKLDVLKRVNETEVAGADGEFSPSARRETFTVNTTVNYSFSTQVRGGMTATWTDTNSRTRPGTHTRELRIFAEMRF